MGCCPSKADTRANNARHLQSVPSSRPSSSSTSRVAACPLWTARSVSPYSRRYPWTHRANEAYAGQPLSIGITLAGVKGLRAAVVAYTVDRPADPIVTTADIATKIVIPATAGLAGGRQCYVDLDGGRHRAKPTHFISHTWQAEGLGMLDAVVQHGDGVVAAGNPPAVYYLDLASVDQHQINQVGAPMGW